MIGRSLFLAGLCAAPAVIAQTADIFHWDHVKPSENLKWVDCYSIYQCARLEVPMDYANPNVGTAAIAVIKLAADVSKEEYRGPILFNPGGPGGSGVDTLVSTGPEAFRIVLGNQFDIVSFDPRGVSYSTPTASFFTTEAERALYNAAAIPVSLNASSDALPEAYARSKLIGQLAAQRDSTGILKYMTSDNVARDMLRITQKFGFEKLQYYGISYGTVIGATFAALFPDKVERIIIDGVVDVESWINGMYITILEDTDKVLQTFFDGCVAAGPTQCAFYESTATEVADRLAALTASIRAQPVPVVTPTSYGIVDYSLLRVTIFNALYTPYSSFGPLAAALATLEAGNGTAFYSLLQQPPFECECNTTDALPFHLNSAEAGVAIQCGDAGPVTDSLPQLQEFYENATRTSPFAEFLVGSNRLSCAGWPIHRDDRFKGPVAAKNTSFPLLIIANTADPVTPKVAAVKVQAGFPGSVLLTQDSPGHTSLAAPSLCTLGYFQQYLLNGTLPEPGTVCPVDATLFAEDTTFGTLSTGTAVRREELALSTETKAALEAMKAIGNALRPVITRKYGYGG
ncbi:TAP-like protein-domain-containing protein [Mycena crocata]|nr:TAP-like protein-domain-containing protein [Mycena crocata]